ncbi:hypothetical protein [Streptomyces wuyuanensis]|uniref:hypothetical protein n=1 Tax=Streptomyces wuyuanensis TaxID=1196353 RepID=UPI0037B1FB50
MAAQFTVRNRGAKTAPAAVMRYFAVPVTASGSAAGVGEFTVTAAPAEVAGPTTAKAQPPAAADVLPSNGAVAATLGEFFRAYLLGVGEVDRYLSPGTSLTAARGGGYTSVTVDRVAADTDRAGGLVPADGSTARVEARVTATDAAGGRWPLAYSLALASRSGRWEVTALRAGADSQVPDRRGQGGRSPRHHRFRRCRAGPGPPEGSPAFDTRGGGGSSGRPVHLPTRIRGGGGESAAPGAPGALRHSWSTARIIAFRSTPATWAPSRVTVGLGHAAFSAAAICSIAP